MTCSRSPNQEVTEPTVKLGSASNVYHGLKSEEVYGIGGLQPQFLPKEGEFYTPPLRREIPVPPSISGKLHPRAELQS